MCGIFGIISDDIDKTRFEESLKMLYHRGPDYQAVTHGPGYSLGHTRLKIIDTSNMANQPMTSKLTQHCLLYNGEMYNYKEIREELKKFNLEFNTESDTEVFLKNYIKNGDNAFKLVDGIFGAAIFNKNNLTLKLVRDSFGVKPLYYYINGQSIIFSSEIKPILHYLKEYKANEDSYNLSLQYRYNPSRETVFKDVFKLGPGEILTFRCGEKRISNFSKIEDFFKQSNEKSIEENLKESVIKRHVADVSVGTFLSEGIDSNTIAAINAQTELNRDTYSLSFKGAVNEEEGINESSKIHRTTQNIFDYELKDVSDYEKPIFMLEEPVFDSIISPTYYLCKETAKEKKVVLSGEGADEIFNGYVHHQFFFKESFFLRFIPNFIIVLISKVIELIPYQLFENLFNYPGKLGKKGFSKLVTHLKSYPNQFRRYDSIVNLFYQNNILKRHVKSNEIKECFNHNKLSFLNKVTLCDLKFWNTNYTLTRLDKLSMSNSLEARVPFLDKALVGKTISTETNRRFSLSKSKPLLRKALYSITKNNKLANRPKRPFYFPIEEVLDEQFKEWSQKLIKRNHLHKDLHLNEKEVLDLFRFDDDGILATKQRFAICSYLTHRELYFEGIEIYKKYMDFYPKASKIRIEEFENIVS